jgi:Calx-beta domain-containing protein
MTRKQRSLVARAVTLFATALMFPFTPMVSRAPAGAAALPTVSVTSVSITEGTGGTKTLNFTVKQSAPGKSRVFFTTKNDTATAPADYLARTGSVRFAGHKLMRTISVTINGDVLDEPDETFFVELTKATGATIDDGEGVGTILDDDAPPTVQVPATLSVPEGQTGDTTFASIDVTLSAASGQEVDVDWSTADGTATEAGNDYTGRSGTILFAPGETSSTVVIPVLGDVASEADETFTVTLASPGHATLGNATDTVTILDNDPLPTSVPIFDVADVSEHEGASGTSTLTFTVTRGDDTASAVTVDYAISDGTASATSDYTVLSATGTLSFAGGQTNKTVDVTVLGDRKLEHNEMLFLTLSNPSAGALNDPQGTGTIVNDDTKTTAVVKVRASRHRVAVRGRVSPARPRKHELVRLYRKRGAKWVRLTTRKPLLRGHSDSNGDGFTDSRYATTVHRAKRGRCKIVASYPGDKRFTGSKATKLFRC